VLKEFKHIGVTIFAAAVLTAAGCGGGGGGLNAPAPAPTGPPPDAPSALSAVDTAGDDGGSVSLSWTVSADVDATGQRLYRGISSGVYDLVALTTIVDNTTASYTDTNVVDGTMYYYVVRSHDGEQESADSAEANAAAVDNIAPAAISGASGADVASDQGGSVTLSWSVSASADITEQRIYRGTASGTYGVTPVALFSNNTSATYTDAGLTPGTTYFYGLNAFDGSNESATTEVMVTPVDDLIPAAPSAPLAVDTPSDNGGSANLSWTVSTSSDVAEQRLYRGTVSGTYGGTPVATVAGNSTAVYTDSGLVDGTSYYYVVRAFDGTSESASSAEVSVVSSDNIVPTASFTDPNPTTNVAVDQVVGVSFSEAVNGVDGSTVFVDGPAGAVTGVVAYNSGGPSATFTPAAGTGGLSLNSDYTASVGTGITDGSGQAVATDTLNFSTAEGAWGSDAIIDTGTLNGEQPQVAFGGDGHGMAVWQQLDGSVKLNIYAARYDTSTGWETEVLIDNAIGDASGADVAVGPNGDAVVVWAQKDGTRRDIWSASYDAVSDTWGTPALLESNNNGQAVGVKVVMDAAGDAVATWYQNDGGYNIYATRYVSGTWGAATLVGNASPAGAAQIPDVGVAANGDAVVVWYESDATRDNIWANHFDVVGGVWGTPELIESVNTGAALNPSVAVDANGNAVAVWHHWDGVRYNIWGNTYDAVSGLWGTEALIETEDLGFAQNARVAMDDNGNAVAVWHQSDGSRFNIWSNRYDAVGDAWGTAALVETDNTGGAQFPNIALHAGGHGVAVWYQGDGSVYNATASRYDAVSGFGSTTTLEADNAGDALQAQVAVGPQGRAIAIWSQSNGLRKDIRANRFQ
jgi:fibronectin type 3 domain-containing protein